MVTGIMTSDSSNDRTGEFKQEVHSLLQNMALNILFYRTGKKSDISVQQKQSTPPELIYSKVVLSRWPDYVTMLFVSSNIKHMGQLYVH